MKMNRDTDTPGKEFFVAVAGPLVTLAIVLVGTAVGIALAGAERRSSTPPGSTAAAPSDAATAARLLPRDDERGPARVQPHPRVPARRRPDRPLVVWKLTGDRNGATRVRRLRRPGLRGAADLHRAVGGARCLITVLGLNFDTIDGIWLAVLGYLLWQSARAAMLQTAVTSRLEGVTVADIMDSEPVTIPADLPALAGLRRVLPALPGLAVVRGRSRPTGTSPASPTATPSRPPRTPGAPTPVRELARRLGRGPRRRAAGGAAGLRAAAPRSAR